MITIIIISMLIAMIGFFGWKTSTWLYEEAYICGFGLHDWSENEWTCERMPRIDAIRLASSRNNIRLITKEEYEQSVNLIMWG